MTIAESCLLFVAVFFFLDKVLKFLQQQLYMAQLQSSAQSLSVHIQVHGH